MLIRYDTALVILFSTLFATFLFYYIIKKFFKVKNYNVIWIATSIFFISFGFVDFLTHLKPYKPTETYFNMLRNVFYIVPYIGLILFLYKFFQKVYKFIIKRN